MRLIEPRLVEPRLVEPLGLLQAEAAREAIAGGLALRLAGGPTAFTLVRLVGPGARPHPIVPVAAVSEEWRELLSRATAAPPPWAGLPADRPLVMGILNTTPDSFSDGGDRLDPARAIAAGRAMAEAGADIIDVGGESTRPGATPVPPEEEQRRILPVLRTLAADGLAVSIDTRNAATMAAALDAGAAIVNDVSGLAHDPDALALVAARRCPVVLMHMRGVPQTMAGLTHYDDVAIDSARELGQRLEAALAAGIARDRIVLDPGVGFAKDGPQSLAVMRRLPLLAGFGCRILVGASRKSLIGTILGPIPPQQRMPGSLAMALFSLARGASILRVHDVAETVQAVRVWQALEA